MRIGVTLFQRVTFFPDRLEHRSGVFIDPGLGVDTVAELFKMRQDLLGLFRRTERKIGAPDRAGQHRTQTIVEFLHVDPIRVLQVRRIALDHGIVLERCDLARPHHFLLQPDERRHRGPVGPGLFGKAVFQSPGRQRRSVDLLVVHRYQAAVQQSAQYSVNRGARKIQLICDRLTRTAARLADNPESIQPT